MKNLSLLLLAFMLYSCISNKTTMQGSHKTPRAFRMTQKEKENQNYDLKESKKIIAHNIKFKKANQRAADKKRIADNENAVMLNASSKIKREKKSNAQAFSFYH